MKSGISVFLVAFATVLIIQPSAAPAAQRHAFSAAQADGSRPQRARVTLKHIVVVIQENRSVDDLFNGFCMPHGGACVDTVTVDPVTGTVLAPVPLDDTFAPADSHRQFVNDVDNGKMDGFSDPLGRCTGLPCTKTVFDYVPSMEVQTYWHLAADDGSFSDMTEAPQQGPGLPAHLYAIAGQSGGYDPDHLALSGGSGTCLTSNLVPQINVDTGVSGPRTLPCKGFPTIFDLLTRRGHTWRYYTPNLTDFRAAPEMITHLNMSQNVIVPSTQFLSDIANGTLADVTYVMPPPHDADHPGLVNRNAAGPKWIASVVNAIGQSTFWGSTAVVVFWDDWGGYYDHVAPRYNNGFEYGFRVPLIVASPYAKAGWIDHTPRTFVSTLRLIEDVFALPSLGTDDALEPDGLTTMFDFTQKPRGFKPVR